MLALFEQYPQLIEKLPHVSLGQFPTPVHKLERLGTKLNLDNLYIKRDDLSGVPYGGNKLRRLEFILGATLRARKKAVAVFGCAGSNHVLASAIYGRQLGLRVICMLMPQTNARYVRRNLLMSYANGAELHACGLKEETRISSYLVLLQTYYQLARSWLKNGQRPQLIDPGNSSSLGIVGYVNAGFELRDQINYHNIPEPDYIYVAAASMCTAAGLILGLKLGGLKSHVISIRVHNQTSVNVRGMADLVQKTSSFLNSLDSSFPQVQYLERDIDIRHNFIGRRYGVFSEQGMEAVALMKQTEGIELDGNYTGKVLAAIIADAREKALEGKVVLFWNTVNSRDFSNAIKTVDYHSLPRSFHHYFTDEIQPLDR